MLLKLSELSVTYYTMRNPWHHLCCHAEQLEATQNSDSALPPTNQLPFPKLCTHHVESGTGLALERPILPSHAPHKPFLPVINMIHSTTAVKFFWLRKTYGKSKLKTAHTEENMHQKYVKWQLKLTCGTKRKMSYLPESVASCRSLKVTSLQFTHLMLFICAWFWNYSNSTIIWRQHNCWSGAAQSPYPPLPPAVRPSLGLTGRVVRELVVFSLCG